MLDKPTSVWNNTDILWVVIVVMVLTLLAVTGHTAHPHNFVHW